MKKPLLFGLTAAAMALGFGQSGFAFQSYDCVAQVTGKGVLSQMSEKQAFKLIEGQRSLVSFDDIVTDLDVGINVGSKQGLTTYLVYSSYYVAPVANSKVGELVELENDHAKVALQCKPSAAVDTYLVAGFTRAILSPTQSGATCYEGNSQKASAALALGLQLMNVKQSSVSKNGTVSITQNESYCANGEGTNVDDYVCHQYSKHDVTYSLPRCASLAKTEDVCVATAIVDVPPNGPGMGVTKEIQCAQRGLIEVR